MYLISAYFDEETNKKIMSWIDRIARETGNIFMTSNHVPPHLTVASVEARNEEVLKPVMEELSKTMYTGPVQFVSVGALLPYVLYVTPVLNGYLQEMSIQVFDRIPKNEEITINKFYRPLQWLPHVTVGKTLDKEQMQKAFAVMQECFVPFTGKIVSMGLAKTNPHEDVMCITLKEE